MEILIGIAGVIGFVFFLRWLFTPIKKKEINTLDGYPIKTAKHYGFTFNDWRKLYGYALVDRSVPEGDLNDYCSQCGWPNKSDWTRIFSPGASRLDQQQYTLWLKFIGVLDPDRSPDGAASVAQYIKTLK